MTETREAFDFPAAAQHMRERGFSAVTPWTLRRMASSGDLRALRCGKRIYITAEALAELIVKLERRGVAVK